MDKIKLSDQLGAMAIIDALHAQQIAVDEHLDLPLLRQKISQRIRDYYQQSGMAVNDELIEEGVKTWFKHRLSYQSPALTLSQRIGTSLYLTSPKWLKGLSVLLLCIMLFTGYRIYDSHRQQEALNSSLAVQINRSHDLTGIADYIKGTLDVANKAALVWATRPLADVDDKVNGMLAQFARQQPQTLAIADAREQREAQLQALIALNDRQRDLLQNASSLIGDVPRLLRADGSLQKITTDPQFPVLLAQSSDVAAKFEAAKRAILENSPTMEAAVAEVSPVIEQQKKRAERAALFEEKKNKLLGLPLSSHDRKTVSDFIAGQARIQAENENMNVAVPTEWIASLNRLDEMYAYIVEPLTFIVVDRIGEKSGVERTYDESGGRSWYLIAEAINSRGVPQAVWVKDSETGRERKTTTFGIRISQAEYEKLKKDKQDDGHIDNYIVGNKPANQLNIRYQRPVMNGRILSW
ncbi:hypothetical protein F3J28_04560 [Enterobacter sp. Ap-1006]|uniref:DUF6384 family protein n=1 Tax=Enterobacter sp. Ap-1006 TaxID=2608345 RepID=UPI00141DEFD0|nr:DUF6384 family protein [Enterobacter sp. Ap-1006]NIF47040.1 hypothetical protein [Enterobacter sp. Ap-1006]